MPRKWFNVKKSAQRDQEHVHVSVEQEPPVAVNKDGHGEGRVKRNERAT